MTMTPTDLKEYIKKHNIKMIDAKFVDFLGQWKHLTYPIERLQEGLEDGYGFDGSSIGGWRAINSSDMLLKPDPTTAVIDPFLKTPTLSILCDVIDPITHEAYSRDPRNLAKRAVAYLKSTGIADTAYFGPEAEFFIFDSIQYSEEPNNSFFNIDSDEAGWNNKRTEGGGNKGFKPPTKGGYCVAGPTDPAALLRYAQRCGVSVSLRALRNLGTGIALLEIPKINLVHPIFEGVEETVIHWGPGHWPGSAIPSWQKSSNKFAKK